MNRHEQNTPPKPLHLATLAAVIGHDQDWQYPAITEKHAFDRMRQQSQAGADPGRAVYLGFPWATLIDLKRHAGHRHDKIGALEQARSDLAAQAQGAKQVFTVCQHIDMAQYLGEFTAAGVTDIFWSHASSQPLPAGDRSLRIHPFPLYPVQQVVTGYQALDAVRPILFSFVGARAEHYYLTDIRNQILDLLADDPRGRIIDRDSWHYEKIVYEAQVQAHEVAAPELINAKASAEFRSIMAQSVFTLCPSGTGPNSIRLWEAMLNNSIPVVMSDSYRFPGTGPEDAALWALATLSCAETPEAVQALPDRLAAIAADPDLLRRKRLALYLLAAKYGPTDFVHDICQAMGAQTEPDMAQPPVQAELHWTQHEMAKALLRAEASQQQGARAEAALAAVYHSSSWAVTAPLRWIRRLMS